MGWILFLDDERHPVDYVTEEEAKTVVWCSTLEQAGYAVLVHGMPDFMYLDHDLGLPVSWRDKGLSNDPGLFDTSMDFLKDLVHDFPDTDPPGYKIISANPVGSMNIMSFMVSWAKSRKL